MCMCVQHCRTNLLKVIWEEGRVAAKVSHARGGLITTAKVVAGEFITPHQLLPTLAKPAQIAKAKARRSAVLKIDVA